MTAAQTDAWPLTGRSGELQRVSAALTGRQPRSVVIAGAAGTGKTRLVREALAGAGKAGWQTHWVAGTAATAAVPLGAVAHLIPDADARHSPFTLMKSAAGALTSQAGARLAVGVDDAHLLDELSLAFLSQFAVTGRIPLAVTVRTGTPVPGQLQALWKDGLADWLELPPLSRSQLDGLIRAVLGGLVDSRTSGQLRQAAAGNLLFLRELIDGGLADGRLGFRDGVWRWEGSLSPAPRLAEIVRAELGAMDPAEWAALELLSLSQPAELAQLTQLVSPDTVTALERRGAVTVTGTGPRAQAMLAHPLYTETVLAQTPQAAASGLRRRIAATLPPGQAAGLPLGRLAAYSDGTLAQPAALADASMLAAAEREYELAERLAHTAMAGCAPTACAALVEALHWQGRCADAEQVAAAAARQPLPPPARQRLAVARALNLFFGLGRPDEAESTLLAAQAALAGRRELDSIRALRGVFAFFRGRPQEAIHLGHEVRTSAASPQARAWAYAGAAAGLAVTGRTRDGLATVTSGWAELGGSAPSTGSGLLRATLATAELLALLLGGRINAALTRAAQWHEDVLAGPPSALDAVASFHLGWSSLAAGRLHNAIRWLAEAAAGLRQRDPAGLAHLCLAQLAEACVLADTSVPGHQVLTTADLPGHGAITAFESERLVAEGLLGLDTDLTGTAGLLRRAAGAAAVMGQPALQARALHGLAYLGRARLRGRCGGWPHSSTARSR